jgi:DNA-binding protein HU-beta
VEPPGNTVPPVKAVVDGLSRLKYLLKGERLMNKGDLINAVAKIVDTKKSAQEVVDCVFSSITKSLKKGEDATIVGFGTFKVIKRKARKGRNPNTGEVIKIKATKAPKFTAGKALKDAVK